jgi:hypothetical protein
MKIAKAIAVRRRSPTTSIPPDFPEYRELCSGIPCILPLRAGKGSNPGAPRPGYFFPMQYRKFRVRK